MYIRVSSSGVRIIPFGVDQNVLDDEFEPEEMMTLSVIFMFRIFTSRQIR